MRIGVNSRIYQNKKTGIPYFVEQLYHKLLGIDKVNDYIFFQTNSNKTIGKTKTLKVLQNAVGNFLFDSWLINRLIKQNKLKIFHGPANILPFYKIDGVKYVLTVHDLSFLKFPANDSFFFYLYYKSCVGRSLKNADVVVADSESTKKDIIKYYDIPENKIKVIYLGVNDNFFTSQKAKRLIPDNYFFTLTTHPKRKNILSIIDIMTQHKTLLKYKFVIAGLIQKEPLAELEAKIKHLELQDKVVLFGYAKQAELISLYQNAEFFIYPSFYEGFGLPVLEAMACKCLVIASNTSSLPEIIPDKRWLFDPYKEKDIYNKVKHVLNLPNKEKKALAIKNFNFAQCFSWEKTAKNYLAEFMKLV